MRRTLFFLLILLSVGQLARAQGTFCEAVEAIMNDAPNRFKNIRGNPMESTINSAAWSSTLKVPGAVGYRIVQSAGLFYQAAFVATTNKDDLGPVYQEYKKKLIACLEPMGYKMTTHENLTASLGNFPKLIFIKDVSDDVTLTMLPPHITMETMYNKDVKDKFSIVMFIFQH